MECVWQCQDVYGVLGVYWDASNDSRFSGTRKHIGASGDSKGMQGYRKSVWGCQGVSWCVGDVKGVLGLAGTLGTQGPVGYRGHQGVPKGCRCVGSSFSNVIAVYGC